MDKIKSFTILKIGYTAGVYGCTGEIFKVYLNDENNNCIDFFYLNEMYGGDRRLAGYLIENLNLKEKHDYIPYTELKRKRVKELNCYHEKSAIEYIEKNYLNKLKY
jgi:hypothetical protein